MNDFYRVYGENLRKEFEAHMTKKGFNSFSWRLEDKTFSIVYGPVKNETPEVKIFNANQYSRWALSRICIDRNLKLPDSPYGDTIVFMARRDFFCAANDNAIRAMFEAGVVMAFARSIEVHWNFQKALGAVISGLAIHEMAYYKVSVKSGSPISRKIPKDIYDSARKMEHRDMDKRLGCMGKLYESNAELYGEFTKYFPPTIGYMVTDRLEGVFDKYEIKHGVNARDKLNKVPPKEISRTVALLLALYRGSYIGFVRGCVDKFTSMIVNLAREAINEREKALEKAKEETHDKKPSEDANTGIENSSQVVDPNNAEDAVG